MADLNQGIFFSVKTRTWTNKRGSFTVLSSCDIGGVEPSGLNRQMDLLLSSSTGTQAFTMRTVYFTG